MLTAQDKYQKDLTLTELKDLYFNENPALTYAAKNNMEQLFVELEEEEDISPEIANDILQAVHKREIARRIGQEAVKIINGRDGSFSEIERLVHGNALENPVKELSPVSDDIDELLVDNAEEVKWRFNLAPLEGIVRGIGPGSFSVFAARPEVGKTAIWVSFAAAPGGWADQGAKILVIGNEEQQRRTRLRIWSANTGMSHEELSKDPARAKSIYSIHDRIDLYDGVGLTIDDVDAHVAGHNPDILVIDQLDKVRVDGTFNRSDEKLREVYTRTREIAKARNCAVIAISQISAEGQDKLYIDYSLLENSRTGKAAEADLIFCVGAQLQANPFHRVINIPKNKISGKHTPVPCTIVPQLSRYVP